MAGSGTVPVPAQRQGAWWRPRGADVLGVTVDGVPVAVRPVTPADRAWMVEWLRALSQETRYLRFLEHFVDPPPSLVRAMVDDVDGRDHVALVGLVPGRPAFPVPSWPEDMVTPVAEARFVRHGDEPALAEVAYTVMDGWQGRGIGTLLLHELVARARPLGVTGFTGSLVPRNQRSLRLIRKAGPIVRSSSDCGVLDLEVRLTPAAGTRGADDGDDPVRSARVAGVGRVGLEPTTGGL